MPGSDRRLRSRILALCLVALSPARIAPAQVARLVKDLRTPPTGGERSVGAGPAASLGAEAFLAIGFAGLGLEPWTTDGTAAGTRLLLDLSPGSRSSFPRRIRRVGSRVLFSAYTSASGIELWSSDGTVAGTRQVADIRPGRDPSEPEPLGIVGDALLFSADDGVNGRELWRSDGTPAGTWLVRDIRPGPQGSFACGGPLSDECDRFSGVLDDRLFFRADDGTNGPELWRSDGTSTGTVLLKEFASGSAGGDPRYFREGAGRLFFSAIDAEHGDELWSTQGSEVSTLLVRDLVPGAEGSSPWPLGTIQGQLLFSATDGAHGTELWRSDGSEAGTLLVKDIRPGASSSSPREGATLAGRLVFSAASGGTGRNPWITDGTEAGTNLLAGVTETIGIERLGDSVAFGGCCTEGEIGLWRTDGTAAGTIALAPMPSGAAFFEVGGYAQVSSGWVYVFSWDDDFRFATDELWFTDLTPAGTHEVGDLGAPKGSSYPEFLTAVSDGLTFSARADDAVGEIFRTDGTEAGTIEMTPGLRQPWGAAGLANGEAAWSFVVAGFWATQGSTFEHLPGDAGPELVRIGDWVWFSGFDGAHGAELWRTDGSPAGTTLALDLFPGTSSSWPDQIAGAFGPIWFRAPAATTMAGRTLWRFEPAAGTATEFDLGLTLDSEHPVAITPLDPASGSIAFRAAEAVHALDPTTGEVETLRDLQAVPYEPFPRAVIDATLYFIDAELDGTCSLWRSPGTAAGTERVSSFGCRSDPWITGVPDRILAFEDMLYFMGCDPALGCELWRSDGTSGGTGPLLDLAPGELSSSPSDPTAIEGRIYLTLCDPAHGCEPWISDGTPAGTHRVADIAPGGLPANPRDYVLSGDLVYFAADDGTGEELWTLPVEIFYDGFETGDASRWSPPDGR